MSAISEVLHEDPHPHRKVGAIDIAKELDDLKHFTPEAVSHIWAAGGFPEDLDPDDFGRLMHELIGVPGDSPAVGRLFKLADAQGKGKVDLQELVALLAALSVGEEAEKLPLMFDLFDLDGDGYITQQEFTEVVATFWTNARALGLLRFAVEESRLYGAEVFAKRVFASMDKDHDGRLSRDEYKQATLDYIRCGQPMQILDTQCGGHVGAFQLTQPGRIRKIVGRAELQFFTERLQACSELAALCPTFFSSSEADNGKWYVEMEDLCYGYVHPCVLDLKMGTSTIGPDSSPTKRAIVLAKDQKTTSATLGMRFTGMRVWNKTTGEYDRYNKSWGRALTSDEFQAALGLFFHASRRPQELAHRYLLKLQALHRYMSRQTHLLFISSSLLFVYDADEDDLGEDHAGVKDEALKMIDFAHVFTNEVPGNHDQGYLTGLENLLHYCQLLSTQPPPVSS